MAEAEKTRYSDAELEEFKQLILKNWKQHVRITNSCAPR